MSHRDSESLAFPTTSVPTTPSPMYAAEGLDSLRSPHTKALDDSESCLSSGSSFLAKRILNSNPVFLGSGGLPLSAITQKAVKTSFDNSQNSEVRDYMNKQILRLAHMSRKVYLAKMQYQRLRMRELEMMRVIMGDQLDETRGHLNQTECQIGQIRCDLLDGPVASESYMGHGAFFGQFPIFTEDHDRGGAESTRSSEYRVEF